jgi:hypothetical protein
MVSEEVPVSAFVPEKYATCPWEPVYKEEVAMERVPAAPPTNEPRVPEYERPRARAGVEVATP